MKVAIAFAVVYCLQVAWAQCQVDFEQSTYGIFEDIGLEDLALRVCVAALEDCDVQLFTEAGSATASVDYESVDESLQLTPGNRECVGVIIEEDVDVEGNETFDVVLRESDTGDELNRVTVTLFDEEDVTFVYIEDTPRVVDNEVTLNFQLGQAADQAQCEVLNSNNVPVAGPVDCSSGLARFTPPGGGLLTLVVTSTGLNGASFTDERNFRLGIRRRCSVILINQGLVIESGSITASFALTAPSGTDPSAVTFVCELSANSITIESSNPCTSPYQPTIRLDPGDYQLRIRLVGRDPDNVCRRIFPNDIRFTVT